MEANMPILLWLIGIPSHYYSACLVYASLTRPACATKYERLECPRAPASGTLRLNLCRTERGTGAAASGLMLCRSSINPGV
jgi:hypothetical protein